jgi:hypothetical protein
MTTALEDFLNEVGKHVHPQKERTLFSLGGRGYYENPASDLLAFFLKPDAEHGFEALFLQAFLECMKLDPADLGMAAGVTVSRDGKTEEGKKIDLVVQGSDWVLLIENKIYHILNNPLDFYEAYGHSLPGGKKLQMAILSPQGIERGNWKPVTYRDYCGALRRRLGEELVNHAYSKWVIFAREFILHLENELGQPIMNNKDADFVEQHAEQINQVTNLAREYRVFLSEFLKGSLSSAIAGHDFRTKDEEWGIRCFSDKWGKSNLVLLPEISDKGTMFKVRVYLENLTPEQEPKASRKLQGMKPTKDGKNCIMFNQTTPAFDKRNEAVNELCRLGGVLAEFFKYPPYPVQPLSSGPTPGT